MQPLLEGSLAPLWARSVLQVLVQTHNTAMLATALRKYSQLNPGKTSQCHPYLLSTKVCIHSNNPSNNRNSHHRSKADNRRVTVLLLVLCQMQERRSDSRHLQVCLARVTQLQSCRESSSYQEKRRRRRRLKDTPVNRSHSPSRLSSGLC